MARVEDREKAFIKFEDSFQKTAKNTQDIIWQNLNYCMYNYQVTIADVILFAGGQIMGM